MCSINKDVKFAHMFFLCSVLGPRKVEHLEVVNVSSSQVWLRWLVQVNRHTAVHQVRVSLVPEDGGRPRTAILNSNVSEYTFRSVMELLSFRHMGTSEIGQWVLFFVIYFSNLCESHFAVEKLHNKIILYK